MPAPISLGNSNSTPTPGPAPVFLAPSGLTIGNDAGLREVTRERETIRITAEQGDAALPRLLRLLDAEGIRVESAALARPSLDDVFLKLTGRSLREAA